jgi:hypothetical protein
MVNVDFSLKYLQFLQLSQFWNGIQLYFVYVNIYAIFFYQNYVNINKSQSMMC